ncbi:hypothetical protein VTH06DRAFT_8090 [Thermothelomyces fergusii]
MPLESNPLISSYTHLKGLPREDEALELLKRLAALVKPLMQARGWKVKTLSEMYPPEANLWGLNVDRSRILIRLRYPHDCTQFLPFEKLVDTMLHELCHLVHGPHDRKFNALWDELREELERLMMKGYTGENNFSGQGRRLGGGGGGGGDPARPDSEKRRPALGFQGVRLGGAGAGRNLGLRDAILQSLARRGHDIGRNCANGRPRSEMQAISEAWIAGGFRTKAEEDAANDAAIAQALWELEQEEMPRKADSRRPPPVPVDSRPPIPPRPRAPELGNFWACAVCTLRNPTTATKCDACESPRPAGNGARGNVRPHRQPTAWRAKAAGAQHGHRAAAAPPAAKMLEMLVLRQRDGASLVDVLAVRQDEGELLTDEAGICGEYRRQTSQ